MAEGEWESMEVLARNLLDIGFKYTWRIPDYLKGVDGEIDVDSPEFLVFPTSHKTIWNFFLLILILILQFLQIPVNGLKTKWSMGIRYWTDEAGLRLTNPVVICLNLVSASATGHDIGIDLVEQLQVNQ